MIITLHVVDTEQAHKIAYMFVNDIRESDNTVGFYTAEGDDYEFMVTQVEVTP